MKVVSVYESIEELNKLVEFLQENGYKKVNNQYYVKLGDTQKTVSFEFIGIGYLLNMVVESPEKADKYCGIDEYDVVGLA